MQLIAAYDKIPASYSPGLKHKHPSCPSRWAIFSAGIALPPFQNFSLQVSALMMSCLFPVPANILTYYWDSWRIPWISISALTLKLWYCTNYITSVTFLLFKMGMMVIFPPGQHPRASARRWRGHGECRAGLDHLKGDAMKLLSRGDAFGRQRLLKNDLGLTWWSSGCEPASQCRDEDLIPGHELRAHVLQVG